MRCRSSFALGERGSLAGTQLDRGLGALDSNAALKARDSGAALAYDDLGFAGANGDRFGVRRAEHDRARSLRIVDHHGGDASLDELEPSPERGEHPAHRYERGLAD